MRFPSTSGEWIQEKWLRDKGYRPLFSVFLGFAFSTAPVQAEIKAHCIGEGPLVYLVGGGPAFTTWNLTPIQQQFNKNYRVCRWDMRGVGDNAGLSIKPEKSALSQWLDDMQATLPPDDIKRLANKISGFIFCEDDVLQPENYTE